ncbi:MAG: spore coat protein CotJB [Epulopiscium sp.]|nr:spore coat protein CotJB [Candidatus Epulonipiscium sp.]
MPMNEREQLLLKIQQLHFATVDLNLYLDTHPACQQALRDYNRYTQELMRLRQMYEMKYGPLTNFGYAPSQYPWQWVNEPWPWE